MHTTNAVCVVATTLWLAASAAAAATPVAAADLGRPYRAASVHDQSYRPAAIGRHGFYVRGDVGIGRHSFGEFSQADLEANGGSFLQGTIDDTVYLAAGIGWQVDPRVRFDVTGEYRSTARFGALDNLTAEILGPDGTLQANTQYDGRLTSYVGLINGYWDLARIGGFTPYVGAGIGFAVNKASGVGTISTATFTDAATGLQQVQLTNGYSRPQTETNLAWALMAGTSYDLSPNAKLDIGYRYLNLGGGVALSSDLLECVCDSVGQPLKLSDLEAHEVRIGIRWMLGAPIETVHQPLK